MKRIVFCLAGILTLFGLSAYAATIRVPQDQPTIQAGINAAVNGDTVLVGPGTYAENIIIDGKNIWVISSNGPNSTIITRFITGQPIVRIFNTGSSTSLTGFTIINGIGNGLADGIYLSNTSVLIENNIVRNNLGGSLGTGLFSWQGGSPVVRNNIFKGHNGYRIVEFVDVNPILERNLIVENTGQAAVFVVGLITALNNTIANSNTEYGFLFEQSSSGQITNNIITNNSLYGIAGADSSVSITYNDLFANTFGPIAGGALGVGNIQADPQFVGGIPFSNNLQLNSPCIDAGDPATPAPPFGGSRVDMGAFEFLGRGFSLLSPSAGGHLKVRKLQFIWSHLRDTTGFISATYRVILAKNSSFAAADSSPNLTDTTWKVPNKLSFGQTYFWKVFAVPDSGDTIFSNVRSFTVLQPPFGSFLPNESSQVRLRQPTFIWQAVRDTSIADSFNVYRVILSKDSGFISADTSPALTDTTWKVPYNLDLNQGYFWKVQAVSDSGDIIYSDSTSTFTVKPPDFSLFEPANSSLLRIRQPTFAWQTVRDTSIQDTFAYKVILSKDVRFSPADTSSAISDTVWKVPYKLDFGETYLWKVQAVYESGDSIYSKAIRTFTIAPPLLQLALPTNTSRVLVKQPTFNWGVVRDTSIPDNFSYRVIYAKNPSFTGATSSPILTDTFWQAPTNLDIATTYYWKVLAFYSSSNDTVFPTQNFSFLLAPTKLEVPGDRPTIQQAIDISLNGDTVLVKPGTYTQNILFKGKKIKLMSEGGPAVTTIAKLVDGFELVSFTNGEDSNTVLSGFTLTGARLVPSGAAINILGASPIIENNYIIDNSGQAAVIWADGGAPKIRRCLMVRDSGEAAIRFFNSSGGEVINCTISDNFGDGIRVQAGLPSRITNNIIVANTGYGIRAMGGSNTNSTITYNDVFANNLGYFFATIPGEGNIFFDPLYRGGNPFSYKLISFSPCIDAGDPAFPVPPGGGSRIDMGAFERTASLPGDLNLDGILTAADVVLQLNCVFLGVGDCPLNLADLNCDNILTAADVVIILNDVFLGIPPPCTL